MDHHLLPTVISDELLNYIRYIEAVVAHVDPEAGIRYIESGDGTQLKVYISPSNPQLKESLVENLVGAHRKRKIPVHFSKSINIQKTITYHIDLK